LKIKVEHGGETLLRLDIADGNSKLGTVVLFLKMEWNMKKLSKYS
jgi:hypothetical protein